MDRLDAMRVFSAVVEGGSFTAASKNLRMPLPTVSRKLTELEAHLGVQLLSRSTRKLALTDTGAAYLAAVQRILEDIDSAEHIAAGEYAVPRGELVVTAPTLFGQLHLVPIIAEFLGHHPQINIHLQLSDRNLHLIEDHVDVAVRIGRLVDSSLRATKVGAMRLLCCAAPAWVAAHGYPETPDALGRVPTVKFEGLDSGNWTFRDKTDGKPILVDIIPRLSVSSAAGAVAAAVLGTGAVRSLNYQVARELETHRLVPLLEEFEPEPLPVNLLHAGGALPVKTRTFLDFAADRLRARLP